MIYRRIIAVIGVLAISLGMASSMITTASAVAPLVAAGALVGIGQIFSWVLNEMTGSDAFDLGSIISECIDVSVDFVESIPERVDIGTQYWVSGINIIGDNVQPIVDAVGQAVADGIIDVEKWASDTAGTIFDGKSIGDVVGSAFGSLADAVNAGIITIGYDENGDVVLSTNDYCSLVDNLYETFGARIDGDQRTFNSLKIISDYIDWYHLGSFFNGKIGTFALMKWSRESFPYFYPFIVTNSGLYILDQFVAPQSWSQGDFMIRYHDYYSRDYYTQFYAQTALKYGNYPYRKFGYSSMDEFIYDIDLNISFDIYEQYITLNEIHPYVDGVSLTRFFTDDEMKFINSSRSVDDVLNNDDVIMSGWVGTGWFYDMVKYHFGPSDVQYDVINSNIPNTNTEDVIKDMGLAGVGSSAKPGTVTMDKTGDVTVTDTKTGAAELVENYPDVTDMDLPQMDQLIDKFPFSLPFDLYKLLTVFVAEPKEPIFEIPISTSLSFEDVTAEIDESVTIDFTQFKFNDIDIIQVLVQSGFYILFVAMLVKITPSLIKH